MMFLGRSISLAYINHTNILMRDFMWNKISVGIPVEIGNIKSLELLLLNGNQLTGSLAEEVGYHPNLDIIQFDQIHISEPIPKSFFYGTANSFTGRRQTPFGSSLLVCTTNCPSTRTKLSDVQDVADSCRTRVVTNVSFGLTLESARGMLNIIAKGRMNFGWIDGSLTSIHAGKTFMAMTAEATTALDVAISMPRRHFKITSVGRDLKKWIHHETFIRMSYYGEYNGHTLGADDDDYSFSWDDKRPGTKILLSKSFLETGIQGLELYKTHSDNYICSLIPGSPNFQTQYTPGEVNPNNSWSYFGRLHALKEWMTALVVGDMD